MAVSYPVTASKFVLFSSILASVLGWFSVVQRLQQHDSPVMNPTGGMVVGCHPQQQTLQEWKSKSRKLQRNITNTNIITSNTSPITRQQQQQKQHSKKRRLRVLLGVFTYDHRLQAPYRRQFRKLFQIFNDNNDGRVCSLQEFEDAPNDETRYDCQLIWTFVVGGLKRDTARSEIVGDDLSVVMPTENIKFQRAKDLRESNDVTYLNIRENMNEGKSQTWFKFAANMMNKYDLDYAGKIDSDSLPYLDKFFTWAYVYLPPPPYNQGILAGVPMDKMWWNKDKATMNTDTNEDFFKNSYGKVVHLYAAGQCYLMSRDLVDTVVLEAPKSRAYREGHEDHDISAMAFHSTNPISFHFLSIQQQFWRHPIKRYKKKVRHWRTMWHNENVRLQKVLALRREYMKNHQDAEEDDAFVTPEEWMPPVQRSLDTTNNNEGDEEVEEEEEGGGDVEEEVEGMLEDDIDQASDIVQ